MPVVHRSITIHAPREKVWALLTDVPRQPLWMTDLKSVEMEPGPLREGSRAVGTVRMFGLSQRDPIEVTLLRPPEAYGVRHLGTFTGSGTFHLSELSPDVTRVSWREELVPDPERLPGMATLGRLPLPAPVRRAAVSLARAATRLVDPLMAPVFSLVFRADLRRLKRLLEGGG